MDETPPHHPDVFTYIHAQSWLSDTFAALQAVDGSITHRSFSQRCGYRSSGGIALIISGKRRLTPQGARRIAKAVGLKADELQHLSLMVAFDHASDFKERSKLLQKMKASRRFAEVWRDTITSYEFYGEWYLPVLREIVSLPDFQEDPKWIAARIHGKLPPRAAAEGLAQLISLGYLERGEDGRLRQTRPIVATDSEVRSDLLKRHQRDMMALAAEALDTQARDERDMRVMTVAISRSQADRIKARLTLLQKELMEIVAEDEPIEQVYQLNTQWFALTNPIGEPSGQEDP